MTTDRTNSRNQSEGAILEAILQPVIRFFLRRGIAFPRFIELARKTYVKVAADEIAKSEKKVNVSRVSVLTGVYRTEVKRFLIDQDVEPADPSGILGRVLAQWENDRKYADKRGNPRILTFNGPGSDFFKLVESISKAVGAAAVLFEAERSGRVVRAKGGIKLLRPVENFSKDVIQGYQLLGQDIQSIIDAVSENLSTKDPIGNLHIRTAFDNIYVRDLPEIRAWLVEQGRELHQRVRAFLTMFDKDINPRTQPGEGAGSKVVFTAFSLITPPKEDDSGTTIK